MVRFGKPKIVSHMTRETVQLATEAGKVRTKLTARLSKDQRGLELLNQLAFLERRLRQSYKTA